MSALFIASHAIAKNVNPRFEYAFENGTVYYDQDGCGSVIRAKMNSGETIEYGDPFEHDANKVDIAVNNASVDKSEWFLPCTAETASVHTRCICALENCGIVSFPDSMINVLDKERDPLRTAAGLDELLEKCYADGKLISEEASYSDIGKITKTEYNIKVEK